TIDAELEAQKSTPFTARFVGIDGQRARVETVDAPSLPDQKITDEVIAQLKKAAWSVRNVDRKERKRNPTAPFTTSKLQQDASRQLGFNVRRTMGVAQRLYEGVEIGNETVGLITYMRTDSTRVAPDAIAGVREWIKSKLGNEYLPASANTFKSKKDAQDAHEAIRPTDVNHHPDEIRRYLSDEQYRLYKLIWQRFVASQMMPAVFDQTTVDIVAKATRSYDFRVTGSVLKFDGFLKVYEESKEKKDEDDEALSNKLPALDQGQSLTLHELKPEQHYTEPPPRYNEASLVKELEERGIGRPSTYASIINTIQDREYAQKIGGRSGRFVPTEIGTVVNDLLVKNFPYIFDTKYTARLEEELDDIEDGREKWTDLLKGFYGHFEGELEDASKHMENIKRMEKPTDEKCPQCGSPLVLKWGKFGSFYACSSYDKKKKGSCDYTRENFESKPHLQTDSQEEQEEEYCENCGRVMVLRNGPWGPFMACPGYNEDPPCKTVRRLNQKQQQKPPEPIDEVCPKCGKQLVKRMGQYGEFISCSGYPKCKYIKQNTIGVICPKCHEGQIVEKKARRGNIFYGCENYPKCDFTANYKPVDQKCPECGSPYLMEKTLKSGVYLVCPNNRKPTAEEEGAKKRRKKGEEEPAIACSYSKRIADVPEAERPTAETHGPLVEQAVS
ncbi:MAG TPA: type I DNA topoisomerase, partial [Pseudacidobacterium sp.]|nr:type I DNA topoisomerase [Pseudacidobacterium sp.]